MNSIGIAEWRTKQQQLRGKAKATNKSKSINSPIQKGRIGGIDLNLRWLTAQRAALLYFSSLGYRPEASLPHQQQTS